ncbi:MAG: pyrroline-5-carboxylate reductase [Betaproteobacteria bacterium]
MNSQIAFIGGGNMASAIINGMLEQGFPKSQISVVEPWPEARDKLKAHFGLQAHEASGSFLEQADIVVWAVKPQTFKEAARQTQFFSRSALHLSVAAGISSDSIAKWLSSERIVRAMPNTPALIGKGITALYARPGVTDEEQHAVVQIVRTTGEFLWVDKEEQLDAVTALSGSGPAYMFFFMEAMTEAGAEMGLTREQAYKLSVATFIGAGELARSSNEPPEILRQRVTSKGGTTHAAITSMEASNIKGLFQRALRAARTRAQELGQEFGEA